jgi:hypothetical protein
MQDMVKIFIYDSGHFSERLDNDEVLEMADMEL